MNPISLADLSVEETYALARGALRVITASRYYHLSPSLWFIPILETVSDDGCYYQDPCPGSLGPMLVAHPMGNKEIGAKYLASVAKVVDIHDRLSIGIPNRPLPKLPTIPTLPLQHYRTLFFSIAWSENDAAIHKRGQTHPYILMEHRTIMSLELRWLGVCIVSIPWMQYFRSITTAGVLVGVRSMMVQRTAKIIIGGFLFITVWFGYMLYGLIGSLWMTILALMALIILGIILLCRHFSI